MRIPLRLVTVIGLFLATTSLRLLADMTPYIGRWQIDIPATLEASKQSPDYNAEDAERAKPGLIKELEILRLTLSEDKLTIGDIKSSVTMPYSLKDTTDGITTITIPSVDNTEVFTCAFTSIGPKQMRFKSSATRQMDYLVWTVATGRDPKAKPAPTIQGNLSAIQAAAGIYSLMNNTQTVPYEALVKGRFFQPLQVVNGEDYTTVVIDLASGTVSVTDQDGVVHTYKKP